MIKKLTYDIEEYNLRKHLSYILDFEELERIHEAGGFDNVGDTPGNDNNSDWHNKFYKEMAYSALILNYVLFLYKEIRPQFSESLVYQKYPTLRIQIPNGKGVAAYHVDSDYNHPKEETNIWLPFTHAKDSRSIYIESEPNKGDFTSQDVEYGQYIMFEGGRLKHGNEINTTHETRVSIDFRIIPLSKFKPSEKKGLAYGKVRDISGENAYYDVIQ